MPGFKIWTNLSPEKTFRLARRAAEDLGFTVRSRDQGAFSAGKGSFALSLFVGAFVAYCDFQVYVDDYENETEIRIERNAPWWTGFIGVSRVKTRAQELATAIADDIEDEGGKVLKEKEY